MLVLNVYGETRMLIDPNDLMLAIAFAGAVSFLCGMFLGALLVEKAVAKEMDEAARGEHGV